MHISNEKLRRIVNKFQKYAHNDVFWCLAVFNYEAKQ